MLFPIQVILPTHIRMQIVQKAKVVFTTLHGHTKATLRLAVVIISLKVLATKIENPSARM